MSCIIYEGLQRKESESERSMEEREARRLVADYADMILRISTNYLKNTSDAEDICQTVFLKYMMSAPEFTSHDHEKAWVIRTTINVCKNELKSAFFRKTTGINEIAERKAPEDPDPAIMEEVMKLPANYRISIYLYYYEGYSASEIADILGKKDSAVMAYLSRGRKKLKIAFSDE